jgi:hypothetical protein
MIIIQLNEHYGRSGCFLILGGVLLNICVCAALYRPLQWELEESEDDDSSLEEEEDDDEEEDEECEEDVEEEPKVLKLAAEETFNDVFDDEFDKKEKQQKNVAPVASQEIASQELDRDLHKNHIVLTQKSYDLDFTGESLSMQKEFELIFKVKPIPSIKMFSSESCLPNMNNMTTNRILSFDMTKMDKILSQTSIYTKKKLQKNRFFSRRKNSILSFTCSLNRCHSLKNKLSVPERNQIMREKNAAFFSDPSTLHYSKYLNSNASLIIKQQNDEEEEDDFKSYLFVNNLYGDEDAHTISNFPANFYYETNEEHATSTSLQNLNIRQNSEPVGLLSMQENNDFKCNSDENKVDEKGNMLKKEIETKPVENKPSGILKFFQDKFKFMSKREENHRKIKLEQAQKVQQPVTLVNVSSKMPVKANNIIKGPKTYANQQNVGYQFNLNTNFRLHTNLPQKFPTNKQAKLFITKCNCKQRHIQNINRRFLNRKLTANGVGNENMRQINANKFISNTNKLNKTRHPSLEAPSAGKVNRANPFMQNGGTTSKNEKFDISKIYNIKGKYLMVLLI